MSFLIRAPRAIEVLIGLICGVIGLGLLSLIALLTYKGLKKGALLDTTFLIIIPIMGVLGVFFCLVSYRLSLNRVARVGGGLLSPAGWRALGAIFSALAITLTRAALWQGQWGQLTAPVFGVVFAVWCFSIARTQSMKDAQN